MKSRTVALQGVKQCWNFNALSPEKIVQGVDELTSRCKKLFDQVACVPSTEISFDSIIKPLQEIDRILDTDGKLFVFPQHCAIEKNLRDASTEANVKLDAFDVEMGMRKDVFNNVMKFKESCSLDDFEPEDKRYVERWVKNGFRNGLHLSDEKLGEIKSIKHKMSELSIEFQRNLNEDQSQLLFTESELTGVSSSLLDSFKKDEKGRYIVTMKYPHYYPVSRLCQVPETRKKVVTTFLSRCKDSNTEILEKLIELRHKHANLLGYKSHSEYILELRMARHPDKVNAFLEELKVKLKPLLQKEREESLKLKEDECKKLGYDFNGKIDAWDTSYYNNLVEVTHYSVDQEQLKPFFPIDVVTKELLDIYQELLNLQFTKVLFEAWHPDVLTYKVEDGETKELMGYFFMDLYPREGKFGHAAVFSLQPACLDQEDNCCQVSVAALMTNFPQPTGGKPSLLNHKEILTYFHEFGHLMHQICSRAKLAKFAGTKTERDFVEAPSQMLENWVWQSEILKRLSSHHETKEKLPDNVIENLVKSRNVNTAHLNLTQLVYALFDQKIHSSPHANTSELYSKMFKDILEIDTIPETNMTASFGHLAGGYDAQYYGYLWSEVFSVDMFSSEFEKMGIMDKQTGLKYRKCILEPGGSIDGGDMLKNFLGREPSPMPFFRSKGLQ